MRAVAERRGVTPAQIALAWVLSRGEHVLAIPGTQRRKYLEENVAAAAITLTPAELTELDAVPGAGRGTVLSFKFKSSWSGQNVELET